MIIDIRAELCVEYGKGGLKHLEDSQCDKGILRAPVRAAENSRRECLPYRGAASLAHNGSVERVRVDKWLWAARFFKTRSLAAHACELGRIQINGQPVKASREVRAGEMVRVKNDSGDFQIEVLSLSEMRGPAAVAQTLYSETEASRELRKKLAEERKAMPYFEGLPEGKPSKRDRRKIDRLRGRG
jgi:ribosome-associated heat shock protein Hsp15